MKSKWMLPGVLLGILTLSTSMPAAAQAPQAELTGEYSYLRFNPTLPALHNRNFNGGGMDASFFVTHGIGIKAEMLFYGSTDFSATFPTTVTPKGTIPAGSYTSNGNLQTYLFGPIVKGRYKYFEPFGQILFGVAHLNGYSNLSRVVAGAPGSTFRAEGAQTPFALAVGGGIDVPVNREIAIRVADIDYLMTRLTNPFTSTTNQNHFRYAAGVQFRFGS